MEKIKKSVNLKGVHKSKVEYFINIYNQYKDNDSLYIQSIGKAMVYDIPEVFFGEFTFLEFLYRNNSWKSDNNKRENDVVRKTLKYFILASITDKFDDNINNYYLLKTYLNNRKENRLDYVDKNIFFLFNKAVRNSDLDEIEKYNL